MRPSLPPPSPPSAPPQPKVYHIVHVDRLASIVEDGCLWSDAEAQRRGVGGTTIGIAEIKQRRLTNRLRSHKGLCVGDCVPFYFCPRSVMLHTIFRGNHPELQYRGGQGPIIHLEADLRQTAARAETNDRRWAFTTSNAGSYYFEDYSELSQLNILDWNVIGSRDWAGERKGPKQAEFLVEHSFPWSLVSRIGVRSSWIRDRVWKALQASCHRPSVEIKPCWYY